MFKRAITLTLTCVCISCGPAPTQDPAPYATPSSFAMPSPEASSLNQLVPDTVISNGERDLRAFQKRSLAFKFPVKIGLIFINHQSNLKADEKQDVFEKMKKELDDSALVSEFIEIPSKLLDSGTTTNAIRLLGSRFQVDIVVILTGTQEFGKASEQQVNFLDLFSNRRAYESHSKLEALLLNVFSGTFLSALQGAGQAGPEILDPEDISFNGGKHNLEKEAEEKAWDKMTSNLLSNLRQTRDFLLENPEPELDLNGNPLNRHSSPTPVVGPTPSPVATPTPQSTPSPAEANDSSQTTSPIASRSPDITESPPPLKSSPAPLTSQGNSGPSPQPTTNGGIQS